MSQKAFLLINVIKFSQWSGSDLGLSLGTHLFVKIPRPGDSKVTYSVFELSCHLAVTTSLTIQR